MRAPANTHFYPPVLDDLALPKRPLSLPEKQAPTGRQSNITRESNGFGKGNGIFQGDPIRSQKRKKAL